MRNRVIAAGGRRVAGLGGILLACGIMLPFAAPSGGQIVLAPKAASRPAPEIKYWIAVLDSDDVKLDRDQLSKFCMILDTLAQRRGWHALCEFSHMNTKLSEACHTDDKKIDPQCEALIFSLSDRTDPNVKTLVLTAQETARWWKKIHEVACGYGQGLTDCVNEDLLREFATKVLDYHQLCHEQGKKCTQDLQSEP